MPKQHKSSLEYLLIALIPYSVSNLKLTFLPHRFFTDLEKISRSKEASLRSTMYRAKKQGLIEVKNSVPVLTEKGRTRIKPYIAKKLKKDVMLLVMFDIPEEERIKRRLLRRYLQALDFRQIQKSVWATDMDYRKEVRAYVDSLKLNDCIEVLEAAKI